MSAPYLINEIRMDSPWQVCRVLVIHAAVSFSLRFLWHQEMKCACFPEPPIHQNVITFAYYYGISFLVLLLIRNNRTSFHHQCGIRIRINNQWRVLPHHIHSRKCAVFTVWWYEVCHSVFIVDCDFSVVAVDANNSVSSSAFHIILFLKTQQSVDVSAVVLQCHLKALWGTVDICFRDNRFYYLGIYKFFPSINCMYPQTNVGCSFTLIAQSLAGRVLRLRFVHRLCDTGLTMLNRHFVATFRSRFHTSWTNTWHGYHIICGKYSFGLYDDVGPVELNSVITLIGMMSGIIGWLNQSNVLRVIGHRFDSRNGTNAGWLFPRFRV